MGTDDFMANATIELISSKRHVWDALVTPSAIKQYMFGTHVESGWREGSEISRKGEFKGKAYEDKGVILKIEPEVMLQYSHFSAMSGKPDLPENYHTVTIYLADGADKTELSLTQDNNADDKSRLESEKTWSTMLEGLKKYVEAADTSLTT